MPLHIGKGRDVSTAISDIIDYVENPQKTDNGRLIYGYECDTRTADAEFLLSKRQYINLTGRQRGTDDVIAYHLRQSFMPGEITPEKSNEIGRELALKLTKGNNAFIVCTHIVNELIMLKGGYQSKVRPAVPHVLMWCMNAMGSTLNLFLFRASYVKIYMDLGMDEATATAAVNQTAEFWCAPQNILISLCVTAILCVGGYLLGVKMLGKHFKPAGVA